VHESSLPVSEELPFGQGAHTRSTTGPQSTAAKNICRSQLVHAWQVAFVVPVLEKVPLVHVVQTVFDCGVQAVVLLPGSHASATGFVQVAQLGPSEMAAVE